MRECITEIVVSTFQYLTWPLSVVILARIFKDQIKGVSKIKIKDYEIELQNEITKIAEDINKTNRDWKITSTKFFKDNMLGLVEKSPLAVVLQTWDILENTIITTTEVYGDYKNYTVGAVLQDLYNKQYISEELLNYYFRLYAIKIKMCNFENEKVTKARVIEFSDTALSICNTFVEVMKNKKPTK